ncbi:unnamed protein product [Prorocentrum cordatum]|uniref:Uncharacterized protein n=1 Tax=Prorocentrum cordatum TaxID=2364126 RepID=A0ABN9U8Z9_9DINO|nr:unnamed protein product [Polarella glacialis]
MEFEAQRLCEIAQQRLSFVAAQVGAGMPESVLLQAQANSLVATFSASQAVTMTVATQVTGHITRGPWTADQKLQLATALNDAAAARELQRRGPARCQQLCLEVHTFLTQSDWAALCDPMQSELAKANVVGTRMWRCGITCPAEKTLMAAGAVILCSHYSDVSAISGDHKRKTCENVQSVIKSIDKTKAYPHAHRPRYTTPAGLDAGSFRFAYPDPSDPPVACPAEVDVTKITMCYRNTANERRASSAPPTVPARPAFASSGDQPPAMQLALPRADRPQYQCPLQLLASLATQALGQGGFDALQPLANQFGLNFQPQMFQQPAAPPYFIARPPSAAAAAAGAADLPAQAVSAGGPTAPHHPPVDPDDELLELEQSMVDAAKAKKKRDAAAARSAKKAKRTVDYSQWLKPHDAKGTTRGAYTSRAYDNAKLLASSYGHSDDAIVKIARKAYSDAADVWGKANKAGGRK